MESNFGYVEKVQEFVAKEFNDNVLPTLMGNLQAL